MTEKRRVLATSTHFDVQKKVEMPDSEFEVENHQKGQMLIDPEDYEGLNTHSGADLKVKKLKASTEETDMVSTDEEDTDELPTEDVPDETVADLDEDNGLDDFAEDNADDIEDEVDAADEFEDLPTIDAADTDSDSDAEFDAEEDDAELDSDEAEDFEAAAASDAVCLVDADAVPDECGEDDLQFATTASAVHVIRSNRIIASMGKATAAKIGAADIYLTPQFQDVVVAATTSKGLRKGLVQSGFILASVRLSGSKLSASAVKSQVEAGMRARIEASAKQQKAMEQSLAIAAVGINRRFFKDVNNELKANLEAELVQAGVRGGQNIVRAMFAQHGVSYAKSILTLATKIAAMPEEMRDQYADALDMTEDEMLDNSEVEAEEFEDEEEDFDPIPTSVSAALRNPVRRDGGVLLAGVKTTAALNILNGSQSLI
jgi:hypothetical protein